MKTETPIERVRKQHRPCDWYTCQDQTAHCRDCAETGIWPCDTIAALDALEEIVEQSHAWGLSWQHEYNQEFDKADALQARLAAATVLIRQAMKERHTKRMTISGKWAPEMRCGAPLGTSIDTCPNCAPYRAWLAGTEGEGR